MEMFSDAIILDFQNGSCLSRGLIPSDPTVASIQEIKGKILPFMSKATEAELEVSGGYSGEKGVYIEGKTTIKWGESSQPPSPGKENSDKSEK